MKMAPKPAKPNGYFMFMTAEQKKLKAQTHRAPPSIREMAGICRESWKSLSDDQRAYWNGLAKKQKQVLQNSDDLSWKRLDSQRQVIADRKDPEKEENKRRTQERQLLQNSWQGQDTRDIVFHILDFQVMYDDILEDQHFPLEIGMVSITLRKGILSFMHRFINPGEVPRGNRHLAVSHSDNSHKIPLQFEHADSNLRALISHMTDFVRSSSKGDELPPVFCLQAHRHLVENCLDFVYSKAYVSDAERIEKLYCLEDLVICLLSNAGKGSTSESQIFDCLRQNKWDYNSSIRCFYHEELDCAFCSLSIARRYSFAIFDMLATSLDFVLTDKHMPDEMETTYSVSGSFGFGRMSAYHHSGDGDMGDRRNRSRKPSSDSSYSNPYSSRYEPPPREYNGHGMTPQNAWQPPRVQPVKVQLSEEEEEEESDDEDEIKPKSTEYSLNKLRLPKSLAQVQTQVGGLNFNEGNKPIPTANHTAMPLGRGGMGLRGATNAAPTRPLGRGIAPSKLGQMRPVGRGALGAPRGLAAPAAAAPVMPPPGFEGAPMGGAPMGAAPGFPPLSWPRVPGLGGAASAAAIVTPMSNEEAFPALSRGRGMTRGRGSLPSQQ